MAESSSHTTVSSESIPEDEYSEVEGQYVDGNVTENFFQYTSPEKSVHVKVLKSSTPTSKIETKKLEPSQNRWKIWVRLASKNSTSTLMQQIKKR